MDCDVLSLCLTEAHEGVPESTGCGQGSHEDMQPNFLQIVHKMRAASLAAEEESSKADVDHGPGYDVEKDANAVDSVGIGGRSVSG